MSSVFRNFSTTAWRAHGPPSSGSPGPPFDTRQNRNVSRSIAIVPLSVKLVGIGLRPWMNMPSPRMSSPWQKTQFW